MKQHFCTRLLLILLCGLPALTSYAGIPTPSQANKRFVIAAHEWPPFASRETRYFGVLPRIVTQVLETQGIHIEFRFMPWPDALDGLITEEFDGALIWVSEDLKRDSFLMSDSILSYRSGLYYRKNFPKPQSADDLLGYRIGLNPYYVYDATSYQLMKSRSMTPIKGSNDRQHFDHLLSGEIDFYLSPLVTSVPFLRTHYSPAQQQELAYTTTLLQFPPTHLLVNRQRAGSAEFIEAFNQGLKRLKNDGTLDRYLDDLRFEKY